MSEMGVATVVRRVPARRGDARVDHQPAFVLHRYPWRETSLIVEVLTRDFGRMALVARGAKRPTSQLRGMLSPFCALALSWSGRGDIKTLIRAEWAGGMVPLRGEALLAAFYLNELLVRLLARVDPHPALFGHYTRALQALALQAEGIEAVLRRFEVGLLRELGVLPALEAAADGASIGRETLYRVEPQHGLVAVERAGDDLCVHGSTVIALATGELDTERAAVEAKAMLRALIRYHLDGRPLNTRRILRDLREL